MSYLRAAISGGIRAINHVRSVGKATMVRSALRAMSYDRDVRSPCRVVILAPHMDDEVIGCGGLIHRLHHRGDRVVCVYFTDGAFGLAGAEREARSRLRYDESRAAASILGVDRLVFLGRPDGGLAPAPDLIRDLLDILKEERPTLLFLPYPFDPHSDHRAVCATVAGMIGCAELENVGLFLYQIRAPIPWPAIRMVLDISRELPAKRSAMDMFVSQRRVIFELATHQASCQRFLIGWRQAAVEVFATLDTARMASMALHDKAVAPQADSLLSVGRYAIRRGRRLDHRENAGRGHAPEIYI